MSLDQFQFRLNRQFQSADRAWSRPKKKENLRTVQKSSLFVTLLEGKRQFHFLRKSIRSHKPISLYATNLLVVVLKSKILEKYET